MNDKDKSKVGSWMPLLHTTDTGKHLRNWMPIDPCRGDGHHLVCKDCLGQESINFDFAEATTGKKKCRKCKLTKPLSEFPVKGPACPLHARCKYTKMGRCKVQILYIDSIVQILTDDKSGIGDRLSDLDMQRIGYHLVPLYLQLVKFKMIAQAVPQPVVATMKSIQVHPIYREIRDVLKHIAREWQDLGLSEIWQEKFGTRPPVGGHDPFASDGKGDKGAIEAVRNA